MLKEKIYIQNSISRILYPVKKNPRKCIQKDTFSGK